MIRTVTPNPALDITYRVERLTPHHEHRVHALRERPGGKGLNVAGVLTQLGTPVEVRGLLGGGVGDRVAQSLAADGVPARWTRVAAPARRTVTIVDDGATLFAEAGPRVGPDDWERLRADSLAGLAEGDVLVVSGSLPRGTAPGELRRLVEGARERGVRTVVDGSGPALLEAAAAGADVLKPNARELTEATGAATLPAGVAALRDLGSRHVVVSRGADGLLAVDERGDAVAVPSLGALSGNATGAGDACVAGIARGLAEEASWPDLLADALALSAAAVLAPVAGRIDLSEYDRQRRQARAVPLTEETYGALG